MRPACESQYLPRLGWQRDLIAQGLGADEVARLAAAAAATPHRAVGTTWTICSKLVCASRGQCCHS
jgi:hypothetical protein